MERSSSSIRGGAVRGGGFAVLLLLAGCTSAEEQTEVGAARITSTPNVLLILADDVGIAEIGAYSSVIPGATPGLTPTIDDLATNGMRFDRAWANPVCSPTRATINTGLYGVHSGIGNVVPPSPELDAAAVTLAETLTKTHYTSALFGKWHLGDTDADAPRTVGGFSHFAGSLRAHLGDYFHWRRNVNGVTAWSNTYATTQNVNDATAWMWSRRSPWMAVVAFNAAHEPFHVPPANLYTVPTGQCDDLNGGARSCYQAMIEAMDTEIARLLSRTDFTTTWVIFVGDNGTPVEVAEAGVDMRGHKGGVYEGGLRVPLIIRGPGARPGVSDQLVNTTDLFATIAQITGSNAVPADSRSLVRVVLGQGPSGRTTAYSELFTGTPHEVNGEAAIRDDRYKVIERGGLQSECFDLLNDPVESTSFLVGAWPQECTTLHATMETYHQ